MTTLQFIICFLSTVGYIALGVYSQFKDKNGGYQLGLARGLAFMFTSLPVMIMWLFFVQLGMEKKEQEKFPKAEHYRLISTDSVYIKIK